MMDYKPLLLNSVPRTSDSVEFKSIDPSVHASLSASIKGTLHLRGDSSFETYSKIFNGDVIPSASLLVRPFDTNDVSEIVRFCTQNSLSISVKAGGYGTNGQAVQGDVIVDISLLDDIHLESINSQGGFTSLKDMQSSKHAGKGRQTTEESDASNLLGKRSAEQAFGSQGLSVWPTLYPDGPTSGSGSVEENPHPNAKRKVWPEYVGFGPSGVFDVPPSGSGSGSGIPFSKGGLFSPGVQMGDRPRHESSGSNSSREDGISVGSSQRESDSSLSLRNHGGASESTSATSAHSESPKVVSSDPFGYMASPDVPVSGTAASAPLAPGPSSSSLLQSYVPSGAMPSFMMSLFSPQGHYMPTRVVPSAPHAYMTFGAGAKQKDIDQYSASHPLPATSLSGEPCYTPYHVPFSAHPVGSSVMILGGFGFLSRLHGLSMDNLVEAEVVLADGSIVIASEEENADLFWALRGAGPAFGIVTRCKAQAYPVPVVFAGNLLYKFRRSTAASLIKHFRDCIKNVPRELYANVILTAGPDRDALLVIQLCYLGGQEKGIEFLQAITSWDGEQCLLNEVSEKSFLSQQDSLAQLIHGKPGRKWFIRSDLINTLSDEMIHETVMRFGDTPAGCTWLFELAGGNVSDEHGGCFPTSSRQATWTVAAFHQWELDDNDPRCVTSAEEWIKEVLGSASAGGPYPSFFGIHESPERVKNTFGDNWQRLCELKQKYDPTGVFEHTFWPLDKHGQFKRTLVPTHTHY